jgi:hypothetical protein
VQKAVVYGLIEKREPPCGDIVVELVVLRRRDRLPDTLNMLPINGGLDPVLKTGVQTEIRRFRHETN